MTHIECVYCGATNGADSFGCHACGAPLPIQAKPKPVTVTPEIHFTMSHIPFCTVDELARRIRTIVAQEMLS